MTISSGFTAEEIREFVRLYDEQPRGTKGQWLKEQRAVSKGTFRRWRAAVYAGDVERGLVPRIEGVTRVDEQRAFAQRELRLREEVEAVRQEVAKRDALLEKQDALLVEKDAKIARLELGVDALGKAIGVLHTMREQDPDDFPTTPGV